VSAYFDLGSRTQPVDHGRIETNYCESHRTGKASYPEHASAAARVPDRDCCVPATGTARERLQFEKVNVVLSGAIAANMKFPLVDS
jgi:hypothetical protein